MTVIPYFMPGAVLFKGTCSITGRPHSITSYCSMAHAKANLRKGYPTLVDAALTSQFRYAAAQAIRQKRERKKAALREVEETIAAGDYCSFDQFRRAGLL